METKIMKTFASYIKDVDFNTFYENEMLVDAVLRSVQMIGEAARNIHSDVQTRYLEIPWKEILCLRDIIVYKYSCIDLETIWETITVDFPKLRPQIVKAIEQEERFKMRIPELIQTYIFELIGFIQVATAGPNLRTMKLL